MNRTSSLREGLCTQFQQLRYKKIKTIRSSDAIADEDERIATINTDVLQATEIYEEKKL